MKPLKFEELTLVDEKEVPRPIFHSEWQDIFSRIGRGKALTIPAEKAAPSSVREAVKRLKQRGLLPANFLFASRKQPDGKMISYVINSTESAESHVETTNAAFNKTVNDESVKEYILSQPKYQHALAGIHKQFYGRILSSRTDEREYHRTYGVMKRVQERIQREFGGKFIQEPRPDGTTLFKWIKE